MCFFVCFLCVFCVWKRGEKLRNCSGREQAARKPFFFFVFCFFFFFFLGLEVPGAFYSPSTDYEVVDLQGPPPSKGVGLDSS